MPYVWLLQGKTSLSYDMFRCKACRRTFNERTVTRFIGDGIYEVKN